MKALKLGAGALYAWDCAHVWAVLGDRFQEDCKTEHCEDGSEWLRSYHDGKWTPVDQKTFREQLEATPRVDSEVDLRVRRESALFLLGGRAAMMQLAHPYVAVGIAEHSNLKKNGAQERFYRTFQYMFPMAFGNEKESQLASRAVRSLHSKVHGTFKENVGRFRNGDVFDAANPHAMLWVHMTLVDSALLGYELVIRRLNKDEKDSFVRAANHFAFKFFGIPKSMLFADSREFYRHLRRVLKSDVIAAGDSANEIESFIWKVPQGAWSSWFLISVTRWVTKCTLPDKIVKEFYGRTVSKLERFLCCLVLGQVRFIYRLIPPAFRFLTAYVESEHYKEELFGLNLVLAQMSKKIATASLATLMPMQNNENGEQTRSQ